MSIVPRHNTLELGDHLAAIRKRAYMYCRTPKAPLPIIVEGILKTITDIDLGKATCTEQDELIIIRSEQDWLNVNNTPLEDYFNTIIPNKMHVNSIRTEVFLKAFYIPFYTAGTTGHYGDEDLLEEFKVGTPRSIIENKGRSLIISKRQDLPKNHKIVSERPKQTTTEIENEN